MEAIWRMYPLISSFVFWKEGWIGKGNICAAFGGPQHNPKAKLRQSADQFCSTPFSSKLLRPVHRIVGQRDPRSKESHLPLLQWTSLALGLGRHPRMKWWSFWRNKTPHQWWPVWGVDHLFWEESERSQHVYKIERGSSLNHSGASGNTVPIIVATLVQTKDCQEPMCRAVTAKGKSLGPGEWSIELASHLILKFFPTNSSGCYVWF